MKGQEVDATLAPSGASSVRRASVANDDPVDFYWDAVATTALGKYVTSIEAGFIRDTLSEAGPPVGLAIEMGAGSGRITRGLAGLVKRVLASDVDRRLVRRLSKVAPNVTALLTSPRITEAPISDRGAQCVVCVEVVELTEQPEFFRECRRVLSPGGLLIVTLQNRASWKGLVARCRRARYRTASGAAYYRETVGQCESRWREAGFELVRATGFNWLPFTRASRSPLVPVLAWVESVVGVRRLARLSPWVILALRRSV